MSCDMIFLSRITFPSDYGIVHDVISIYLKTWTCHAGSQGEIKSLFMSLEVVTYKTVSPLVLILSTAVFEVNEMFCQEIRLTTGEYEHCTLVKCVTTNFSHDRVYLRRVLR